MTAYRALHVVAPIEKPENGKADSAQAEQVFTGHIADQQGNDAFHAGKDNPGGDL